MSELPEENTTVVASVVMIFELLFEGLNNGWQFREG